MDLGKMHLNCMFFEDIAKLVYGLSGYLSPFLAELEDFF